MNFPVMSRNSASRLSAILDIRAILTFSETKHKIWEFLMLKFLSIRKPEIFYGFWNRHDFGRIEKNET